MTRPRFYFDFLSPYSYFAWVQLGARRAEFEAVPVVFGALLDANGTLGPAEVPAKRRFFIRDCLRLANRLGVPFCFPAYHPFMPVTALRLAVYELAGERQHDVIDAIWRAGWHDGGDLAEPAVLEAALDGIGLPGTDWLARTRAPAIKQALRANTERAVNAGIFGVPSFHIGDDVVWGSDRMHDVWALLAGEGALDPERVAAMEATPAGVVRK